jgi:hypothetical protein
MARLPLPADHIAAMRRIEICRGFPTGASGAKPCFQSELRAMILDTRPAILQRMTGPDPDGCGRCLTLPDGAQSVKPVAGGLDKGSVVISVVREPLIP